MSTPNQPVLRVQDTARFVAMARALESERKDALFHDPHARKLAGPQGMEIVERLGGKKLGTWPIVARTHLMDSCVLEAVRDGADAVLNLAAGFDTRPYRLGLPASLTWMEVDHADVVASKAAELKDETPTCHLERLAVDLSVAELRREMLANVGKRFRRLLVLSEGLLCYLPPALALELARELSAPPTFRWIFDLPNAAVLRYVAKKTGNAFQGTAKMQFGPDEGPAVFEAMGWRVSRATSIFRTAGKLKRLPFPMSVFARLPEPSYGKPGRPWSGVCVLEPK